MNILKIAKYGRYFNNEKFFAALKKFGKKASFVKKALVLYYCMRDEDTPTLVKSILIGALGYLVLPFDIIPDKLPLIGTVDDAVVIAMATKFAQKYIKPIHVEKAMQKIPFGESVV